MRTTTNRRRTGTGVIAVLLLAAAHAGAQDATELARCSTIENADERLACYDAATRKDKPAPEPAIADAAPEETPLEEVAVLTDEIGEEQLDRKKPQVEERVAARGTVKKCERDASGRHFFYFDNGQIWKQKDPGRLSVRNCSFDVRIERDFFGYKMRIDGQGKDIRISRVR